MKLHLLVAVVLIVNCGLVLGSVLLDCIRECEGQRLSVGNTMRCKRICYENATKGGCEKKTIFECMQVCSRIENETEKQDCISGCSFLFPFRIGGIRKRPPPPQDPKNGEEGSRKRTMPATPMRTWF